MPTVTLVEIACLLDLLAYRMTALEQHGNEGLLDVTPDVLKRPPPNGRRQVEEYLDTMSEGAVAEVNVLIYIGEGGFEPDEFEEQVEEALASGRSVMQSQILTKPDANASLAKGLALMGRRWNA